jgi:UDP:flavonoid glycosyltransferase YjiC (YdhE family)
MRNQMEKIIAECSRCNVEIQFFTDEEFIELIEQHYPICF